MNMVIFGVTFASFQYVWLGILVVIGSLLLLYRYKKTMRITALLSRDQTGYLLQNFSKSRARFKNLIVTVGLVFLYCALLRPQWKETRESVVQEGRDLFIALDVSRSMLVTDCQPNRLACAKNKIKELVHLLSGARVGLVLFSETAFVQCPLTSDYAAFNMFLDSVDVESISSGTTALAGAIQKVIEVFNSMPSKKNKLLVLFTDGEDFSHNLIATKRSAQEIGLSIFAVGIGTVDGAPIPLYDAQGKISGHQKDKHEKIVISRLNEVVLQGLVQDLAGTYIKTTEDGADMQTIARLIATFEKEKFDDREIVQAEEQYPYFLLLSLICFVIEWLF